MHVLQGKKLYKKDRCLINAAPDELCDRLEDRTKDRGDIKMDCHRFR